MGMSTKSPIADTYWIERRRLLAGKYPGSLDDGEARQEIRALLKFGITIFIDLTEEDEFKPYIAALYDEADSLGISAQYQRRPIRELGVPTAKEMIATLDAIQEAIESGATTYLHCSSGIGRTGTVAGCYLVRLGMTGFDALEQIALLRQGTPNRGRESPETDEQRHMVLFPWKVVEES